MLRKILGTGFLLASANILSKPAIAETVVECTYAGASRPAVSGFTPEHVEPEASPALAALDGMLGVSVIYPGIIVLMTMAAYYFLRQLEPQTVHDHPRFVRSAVALSALWLAGFFPFLSSAYGGFMFCVTAMSCTGAWLMMRSFQKPLKFIERMVIFWGFFFFSLFLSMMVTGRGAEMAALFNQPLSALLDTAGEFTRQLGPLLLLAINIWVALRVFRLMGVKISRPGNPETVKRIKVVAMAVTIVVFDIVMMETHFQLAALLPLLLWVMPAVAYYGVYRLVSGAPASLRGRVSPVLFASLAVFLTVLVCLSAGASLQGMLLASLVLALLACAGYGLPMLWKSSLHVAVRAIVTTVIGLGFLGGSWLVFSLAELPQDILALYVGEVIVPVLLSWKVAVVVLPACFYVAYAVLADYAPRVKFVLATATILLLLLAYTGAVMTAQVFTDTHVNYAPADTLKREAPANDPGFMRLDCKKVTR